MKFLGFLRRKVPEKETIEVVSRSPVGRFRVSKILRVMGRQVLIGEVLEGVVYPAYKVKAGKRAALVYRIEKEHRKVEFAAPGDRVALILEGEVEAKAGEEIEVYQS